MLGKLIKYELKASGRVLLPVYGAVILMGLISSLFIKFKPDFNFANKFLTVAAILSIVLFTVLIIASMILSFVFSIYRYKQNLLGSEGYLMNTLPVSIWQNIAAKLTSAVIYQILSIIVACIAGFLFFIVGSNITIADIANAAGKFFNLLIMSSTVDAWLLIAEFILLILLTTITSTLMIYAAMSIGHSFTNHKVLNSVGVYVIFYIASQFINTLLLIGANSVFGNIITGVNMTEQLPHLFFGGMFLLELAYGVIYFIISNYFMKNKLNLQ